MKFCVRIFRYYAAAMILAVYQAESSFAKFRIVVAYA